MHMECRVKEDEEYQLSLLPFWSDNVSYSHFDSNKKGTKRQITLTSELLLKKLLFKPELIFQYFA